MPHEIANVSFEIKKKESYVLAWVVVNSTRSKLALSLYMGRAGMHFLTSLYVPGKHPNWIKPVMKGCYL